MVGGDSKFVLTRTRTHVPTHTQLISQNGKEIEDTHTHSPNGGRDLGKKKNKVNFSVGVDRK